MSVYEEDLDVIAKNIREYDFKDNCVMVTGATGMLGSLLVKGFLRANKIYGLNNKVYALVRNKEKALDVFKGAFSKDLSFIVNDITGNISPIEGVDYFFHTACVTNSKEMSARPVELIKASVFGTYNVLDYCVKNNVKKVVYLSSIEAFGVVNAGRPLSENDLGFIDITKTRSCYPESKRLNENLVKCFFDEYGLDCVNARLAQTFGAGVSLSDNRVFALIAKNVIEGKDIEFKTSGKSAHDYCYTTDCIKALLLLAKKGKAGETYNVSNPKTYSSVYEMAKIVVDNFGDKSLKVIRGKENDSTQYPCESYVNLDISKISELGWSPQYDLIEMYDRLISYYKGEEEHVFKEAKKE